MRSNINPRTSSIRLCMDPETKIRLKNCAAEQRKPVSQLIIDWIWSQPIKADAEWKEGKE